MSYSFAIQMFVSSSEISRMGNPSFSWINFFGMMAFFFSASMAAAFSLPVLFRIFRQCDF